MKKLLYVLVIILLSFTIYSCAKKSDSSSSSSTTTTEVEGTWVVSCYASGSKYLIKTITVSGTSVVEKYEYHLDSSCATDYDTWETTYTSLAIGNEATLDNGSTGRKFTMKVDSFVVSMQAAAAVTDHNSWNFCGYSDWALNTTKDYTGKTCGSTDYAAANTNIYGVYLLEGSSLLISDISSSSSPYQDNVSSVDSMVLTK